jgi:hypothetical protein
MAKRVAKKGKPEHDKRETHAQDVQAIVNIIKENPTVLRDMGVRRALGKLERALNKTERVLMSYERASLFSAADFFAELIKIRTVNKSEFTPGDIALFQQWFSQFRDNFPEFLRMVADLLEGKPVRKQDSEISAAYKEAVKRCNRWFFEPIEDWISRSPSENSNRVRKFLDTGVQPTFSEFEKVFQEQNPKLFEPRKNRPDGIAPSERSLRRSLERLGCITRPDKRGRPKEK